MSGNGLRWKGNDFVFFHLQNLKNRQSSPSLPLKQFHNRIKACLIKRYDLLFHES